MEDSEVDLAATTRIRNGWMKFQELLLFLTSRAPMLEMKGNNNTYVKHPYKTLSHIFLFSDFIDNHIDIL